MANISWMEKFVIKITLVTVRTQHFLKKQFEYTKNLLYLLYEITQSSEKLYHPSSLEDWGQVW